MSYCDCEICHQKVFGSEGHDGPLNTIVRPHPKCSGCGHEAETPAYIDDLKAQIAALTAQLPDGMQHCTIQSKTCEKGHGWLTATNWVQHGCPTCERDALTEQVKAWRLVAAETSIAQAGTDVSTPALFRTSQATAVCELLDAAEKAKKQLAEAREEISSAERCLDDTPAAKYDALDGHELSLNPRIRDLAGKLAEARAKVAEDKIWGDALTEAVSTAEAAEIDMQEHAREVARLLAEEKRARIDAQDKLDAAEEKAAEFMRNRDEWRKKTEAAERANTALREALQEIAKGEGPFNREPLIHAGNTIAHMVAIALAALATPEVPHE